MRFLFIILFLTFKISVFSQSGVYEKAIVSDTEDNVFKWTLKLNSDGTFSYHLFRKLKGGIPPEENFYAKGTWKSEGRIVEFFADENDIDDKYSMNFNNSKARINSKSPRDKSDRIIKTSIQFYQSNLPTIKRLELFKKE